MPVPIHKSDMMLSSLNDQSIWSDTTNLILDDDDWAMNFLNVEQSDKLLNGFSAFDSTNMDFSEIITAPSSPKYQIRHHDCMWSGTCVDKSHPSKKKGINLCPASTSTTSTQQPQNDTCPATQKLTETTAKFGNAKTIMSPSSMGKSIACKDKIPAGRSLLLNPRINTNTAPTKMVHQNKESKNIIGFCKELDTFMDASISSPRPDTPLSSGEYVTEFKHNIDLTPCPSGNRMKFTDASSARIINMLAEHLEETSHSLIDTTPFIGAFKNSQSTPNDLNDVLEDITYLSDYEGSSAVNMNDDDDNVEEIDYKSNKFSKILSMGNLPQATISHHEFISDHSYTRPKGSRYDPMSLGVQTPSDSEEEIDVVNISEKNLPTNPSARDRRALQTTVAHKIARSKHSNQRRRVSDDDSLSSSTSTLSSKGSTPIKVGSQTPQRYVFSSGHSSSRKRKDNNNNMHDSHKKYRHGHSKKQRMSHSKHQKQQQQQQQQVDPDEVETLEKRNLHNNMERQRRIGLKNLFEELKYQIPSLKDKERAPKVNILREAASYCTKLRRDEDLHADLTKKHNRLMTRVRNLKASIAAQQRRHY